MKTQKIDKQPNFNGKLVLLRCDKHINIKSPQFDSKLKEIINLIDEKPYDVFISKNKRNHEFYDVSANTSYDEAKKVKAYTVKVRYNVLLESLVDAVKEAMEMYETYMAKGIKG